jgi:hypothetical protein
VQRLGLGCRQAGGRALVVAGAGERGVAEQAARGVFGQAEGEAHEVEITCPGGQVGRSCPGGQVIVGSRGRPGRRRLA